MEPTSMNSHLPMAKRHIIVGAPQSASLAILACFSNLTWDGTYIVKESQLDSSAFRPKYTFETVGDCVGH